MTIPFLVEKFFILEYNLGIRKGENMYKLVRQKRKTLAIYIQDDLTVLVKAPYTINSKMIDEFVAKHQEWINKTVEEKQQRLQAKDWLAKREILYLGDKLAVEIEESLTLKSTITTSDKHFIIITPNKNDLFLIKKQVEMYMKKQALKLLTQFTQEYCDLLGCKYEKITIRKQKTRWGSCSARGTLSYNVRLIGAPIEVIRYVALHEVVHLIHFDHSKAFWHTIEQIMPDYKLRQNYLKENANILNI